VAVISDIMRGRRPPRPRASSKPRSTGGSFTSQSYAYSSTGSSSESMQDQGDSHDPDHDRASADNYEEPIPDLLWNFMEKCWEDDSYARPSAEDVLAILDSVAAGRGMGRDSHHLFFNGTGDPSSATSKWAFTRERRGSADSEMAVDRLSSSPSVAGSAGGSDESEWMPLPEFGSTLGGPSSRPTSRQRPYTSPSPYSSGYAFTGATSMGYTR
jgi:hypothetical protein